ncbi:MAG TPA: hypothetical protein VG168_00260, partial [Bryobacteraceae bacterium]|nr:hypothetical protein [Bryobacteraceae bacterium]
VSTFIGQAYPWSQAFQFGLLWAVGGAFLFTFGFVASILLGGEYTAAVIAIIVMLGYSVAADQPFMERHFIDVHDLMSGTGMYYFQARTYLLMGPLPWLAMSVIALIVLSSIALAGRITQGQDF